MASTGVYSTAPNIAPIPTSSGGFSPTVLATQTQTPSAGWNLIQYTPAVVDAGTYFVNAEWSAVKTGATFFVGDILLWEISDSAQTLTDRPLVSCSVYQNQYGSDPYAVTGTITGTIILTSATLICWRVSASLPSGGYSSVSVTISNPTYIKKA